MSLFLPKLRFKHLSEYNRYIDGVRRGMAVQTKRRMEYWAKEARTAIRKDKGLFSYSQKPIRDEWTSTPRRRKGALKNSLWTSRAKVRAGKQLAVEMGWGVPYGPILEWGTTKREWPITPKGFRLASSRSGGMTGIKFLRFRWGKKIVYAKKVKHTWSKAQMRPHWRPTLDDMEPRIMDDLGNVMKDVFRDGR